MPKCVKYLELKKSTLKEPNIQKTNDGEFRFVNHNDMVATLGFPSREDLIEYTYIRFDEVTVPLMRSRYKQLFEK